MHEYAVYKVALARHEERVRKAELRARLMPAAQGQPAAGSKARSQGLSLGRMFGRFRPIKLYGEEV